MAFCDIGINDQIDIVELSERRKESKEPKIQILMKIWTQMLSNRRATVVIRNQMHKRRKST